MLFRLFSSVPVLVLVVPVLVLVVPVLVLVVPVLVRPAPAPRGVPAGVAAPPLLTAECLR
jgi:hypothetical protein